MVIVAVAIPVPLVTVVVALVAAVPIAVVTWLPPFQDCLDHRCRGHSRSLGLPWSLPWLPPFPLPLLPGYRRSRDCLDHRCRGHSRPHWFAS
ncbi:MAG: hypothetical protein R3E60_02410 [Alphaproteobacteria bacterium]